MFSPLCSFLCLLFLSLCFNLRLHFCLIFFFPYLVLSLSDWIFSLFTSICPFSLFISLPAYLPIIYSVFLSISLFLSHCISVCLSVSFSHSVLLVFRSVTLSFSLSITLSISLSLSLSLSLFLSFSSFCFTSFLPSSYYLNLTHYFHDDQLNFMLRSSVTRISNNITVVSWLCKAFKRCKTNQSGKKKTATTTTNPERKTETTI